MYGAPYSYEQLNMIASQVSPSTVHCKNTALSNYFRRYLFQKAISPFKWEIEPTWASNYFLYTVYGIGYITVFETDKYGVIPQQCGLQGYNVLYQPVKTVISNPLLRGTITPTIGVNCTLIKLQPDYKGILDLVSYYADQMALASESLSVNFVNSKLAYIYGAQNKSAAESFKKAYDEVSAGNPAVTVDKMLYGDDGKPRWEWFLQNVKQNYVGDMLLSDLRKIEAMFDTDIGIPNANTDKRERLITDEVNANNIETYSKCSIWLEELQKGCKETNEMFGTHLSVDWRFKTDEYKGGATNGTNVGAGAV